MFSTANVSRYTIMENFRLVLIFKKLYFVKLQKLINALQLLQFSYLFFEITSFQKFNYSKITWYTAK